MAVTDPSGSSIANSVTAVIFGPFRFCPREHLLVRDDKKVIVGSRALDLLAVLVARAGTVLTHSELVAGAWPKTVVEESNLRVQIAALRKALGDNTSGARYVVTVPGRGYRFVAQVSALPESQSEPVMNPPAHGRFNNLPPRLTRAIGRDDVIIKAGERLRQWRLVTIAGPGGIGKTTVVMEIAQTLAQSYADGICFVDIASLGDARLIVSAIATALGLQLIRDNADTELIALLRDQRKLLILDSCERFVEAAASLATKLVSSCTSLHVLTTSREPLRAEGERVIRLMPLAVPPDPSRLDPTEALAYSSVQLFVARAAERVEGFALDQTSARIVGDICRRLDGIALAIELAAGRVDAFGVQGVADRLGDRFRLLTRGSRSALPRHRTLEATFDWSYESLSQPERLVIRRLSVFAGGFSLESAAAIVSDANIRSADVADLIADLVSKSLVVAETDNLITRYRLLDTTRVYMSAKLADDGELDDTPRRHLRHYREKFEKAAQEWATHNAADWLSLYGRELDNVRAALDWGSARKCETSEAAMLTVAAIPLWFQLSLTDECRDRVQEALSNIGPGPARDAHARDVMQLYAALGLSRTFTSGLAPEAAAAWSKSLEIAESLDDREHQLGSLWGLWACHIGNAEYRDALSVAETFCRLARASEDSADLLIGDRLRGVPLYYLGENSKARRHIERMLEREAVASDASTSIRARFDQPVAARVILAHMLWLEGLPDQATRTARESLDDARASGHAISLCDALAQAACPVALLTGDLDRAEHLVSSLMEHASNRSLGPWHALGCCLRGELLIKRGDLESGLPLLQSSLGKLEGVRFALYHTGFLGTLAEGFARAGEMGLSRAYIDQATARAARKEEHWCEPELLRIKAEIVLRKNGRSAREQAEKYLLESLQEARQQNALSWQLRSATTLARVWMHRKRDSEARRLLASIYRRFYEGFSTADLCAAKEVLDQLA